MRCGGICSPPGNSSNSCSDPPRSYNLSNVPFTMILHTVMGFVLTFAPLAGLLPDSSGKTSTPTCPPQGGRLIFGAHERTDDLTAITGQAGPVPSSVALLSVP